MIWNYRVVRKVIDGKPHYGIHEVYFDEKTGEPVMATELPEFPYSEELATLKEDVEWMLKSFDHEVLNAEDFGTKYRPSTEDEEG